MELKENEEVKRNYDYALAKKKSDISSSENSESYQEEEDTVGLLHYQVITTLNDILSNTDKFILQISNFLSLSVIFGDEEFWRREFVFSEDNLNLFANAVLDPKSIFTGISDSALHHMVINALKCINQLSIHCSLYSRHWLENGLLGAFMELYISNQKIMSDDTFWVYLINLLSTEFSPFVLKLIGIHELIVPSTIPEFVPSKSYLRLLNIYVKNTSDEDVLISASSILPCLTKNINPEKNYLPEFIELCKTLGPEIIWAQFDDLFKTTNLASKLALVQLISEFAAEGNYYIDINMDDVKDIYIYQRDSELIVYTSIMICCLLESPIFFEKFLTNKDISFFVDMIEDANFDFKQNLLFIVSGYVNNYPIAKFAEVDLEFLNGICDLVKDMLDDDMLCDFLKAIEKFIRCSPPENLESVRELIGFSLTEENFEAFEELSDKEIVEVSSQIYEFVFSN